MKAPLKFAAIGAGFWSSFQLAGWSELPEVEVTAVCDKDFQKAEALAGRYGARAYTDAMEMIENEELDFVDVITDVGSHASLVKLSAERGLDVICQKPMGPDLATAQEMVAACRRAGVRFYVHENFRWQTPLRVLKAELDKGIIGRPFKARVTYCNSFPVFENQPFLAELEQFILTDIGTHILDVVRFLFGEARSLYCRTQRVNADIRGEDVANVLLEMHSGLQCFTEMSYASILEDERFPQTYVLIEGEAGSLKLGPDYEIRTTTREGTTVKLAVPPVYDWSDSAYALAHSAIVATNRNLLDDMLGRSMAETTGVDNLRTLELVFGCYRSAAEGSVVTW